ncbi:MAG: YraN family protein [Hyphomicrobiaceae bacterium]|nr:YraN family protein [Hyphomicrobiaceae bacterium]
MSPASRQKPVPARADRQRRYRRGHVSEWIAAAALMARGYRILGRRVRTPLGEIDLIARRGTRIAFVEVKRRRTLAEGEAALSPRGTRRLQRAAEYWLSRRPALAGCDRGFDAVLVLPWRLPVHLPDALQPAG